MSPALKYEWQFWRLGLRYMASWHTILSCSYDLASNIREVQLAAKMLSLWVSNFGENNEYVSEAIERYSGSQNNLLISMTNFGTWVSYHIPTVLIGYPSQVREYAVHHGRKPIARSKERAIMWTYMWANIYYIIGTQIMWTPTPFLGKEYKKHLGKKTILGHKLSLNSPGVIMGTPLNPQAEKQHLGVMNRPLLNTKIFAQNITKYGLECTGGEAFGKIGDWVELSPYDTIGGLHQVASTGSHKLIIHQNLTKRLGNLLDWTYGDGRDYDAYKPPQCTHKVPEKLVRAYIESQISRMRPPQMGADKLPPFAAVYKPEISNLMNDLWMTPRESDVVEHASNPSAAPASILRYPSAVLEVGIAAAMQPLGSGFMSMNPVSTNMFPSVTQPVALASTP
jgi:hypothetical protein